MALSPSSAFVTLDVFGVSVTVESAAGVFMPTRHGLFYASAASVHPGERVIDIGTGSGVLAIAAAKVGAEVVATDTDPRAVAATRRNAVHNGVRLTCQAGPLFAEAAGPFDVILANLPNEIVVPAYLATLPPEDAQTFAGGSQGNQVLLELLAAAPAYMHSGSRLYLGVHTLTDYHTTLRAALASYNVRLVALAPLPVKSFVLDYLAAYRALNDAGIISIFCTADGRWQAYGYVYELTRK